MASPTIVGCKYGCEQQVATHIRFEEELGCFGVLCTKPTHRNVGSRHIYAYTEEGLGLRQTSIELAALTSYHSGDLQSLFRGGVPIERLAM